MRRTGVLVLAGLFGMLPMLPAVHVHESDHDGHLEALAHRHFAAHSPLLPDHDGDHDRDHNRIADHDDHVVSFDVSFTFLPPYAIATPPDLLVALLPAPPMEVAAGTAPDVERVIHGPPRPASGLRAPPAFSRL